jgi:hypothetical protein
MDKTLCDCCSADISLFSSAAPSAPICKACYERLRAANERLKTELNRTCLWQEDSDGNWDSECGGCYCFEYDLTEDSTYTFCPKCGRRIEIVQYCGDDDE